MHPGGVINIKPLASGQAAHGCCGMRRTLRWQLHFHQISQHLFDLSGQKTHRPFFERLNQWHVIAHKPQIVHVHDAPDKLCQPFFSAAHKVLNDKGKEVAVSNLSDGGSGPSWYLLDTRRSLKPLIYQSRKAPTFVSLTGESDENVFHRSQYIYGVDCRRNAGFGFWQLAHASNKDLTAENLKAAITAMETLTGDHGRPLGISPNLLVVPKALRFVAKKLLESDQVPNAAGTATESNDVKNVVDVLVADWL